MTASPFMDDVKSCIRDDATLNPDPVYSTTPEIQPVVSITLDPDYAYDTADMTLISSDAVSFKVDSFRLRAYSPVFEHMIASLPPAPEKAELTFTDPESEDSKTIKAFLNLITHRTVPALDSSTIDTTMTTGLLTCNLATLLDKYECHTHLDLLQMGLLKDTRRALRSGTGGQACTTLIVVFVIGAQVRDVAVCVEALDLLGVQVDTGNNSERYHKLAYGVHGCQDVAFGFLSQNPASVPLGSAQSGSRTLDNGRDPRQNLSRPRRGWQRLSSSSVELFGEQPGVMSFA